MILRTLSSIRGCRCTSMCIPYWHVGATETIVPYSIFYSSMYCSHFLCFWWKRGGLGGMRGQRRGVQVSTRYIRLLFFYQVLDAATDVPCAMVSTLFNFGPFAMYVRTRSQLSYTRICSLLIIVFGFSVTGYCTGNYICMITKPDK